MDESFVKCSSDWVKAQAQSMLDQLKEGRDKDWEEAVAYQMTKRKFFFGRKFTREEAEKKFKTSGNMFFSVYDNIYMRCCFQEDACKALIKMADLAPNRDVYLSRKDLRSLGI